MDTIWNRVQIMLTPKSEQNSWAHWANSEAPPRQLLLLARRCKAVKLNTCALQTPRESKLWRGRKPAIEHGRSVCVRAGEREGKVIITGKTYNQECIKEVLLYVYMHTGTPSKNGSHSVIGLSKIYIICIFIYVLSSSLLCTSASRPYKAQKVGPKRCGDEPDEWRVWKGTAIIPSPELEKQNPRSSSDALQKPSCFHADDLDAL